MIWFILKCFSFILVIFNLGKKIIILLDCVVINEIRFGVINEEELFFICDDGNV
jgi:hypothetical protein